MNLWVQALHAWMGLPDEAKQDATLSQKSTVPDVVVTTAIPLPVLAANDGEPVAAEPVCESTAA